mgnify:CR=1 FL=1
MPAIIQWALAVVILTKIYSTIAKSLKCKNFEVWVNILSLLSLGILGSWQDNDIEVGFLTGVVYAALPQLYVFAKMMSAGKEKGENKDDANV